MNNRAFLTILGVLMVGLGCVTTQPPGSVAENSASSHPMAVKVTTILPKQFRSSFDPDKISTSIEVPRNLVNVSKIVSNRAALREGPGVQFELFDEILAVNTEVLIFDKIGVWQKVIVMDSWQSGWLHEKMLARSQPVQESVRLEVKPLPTVFAMTAITSATTYPDGKEVKVRIPKGAIFKTIKHEGRRSLVWLAQTNSVIWLHQEKVQ